jgi:hypothetical protein
MRKHIASLLLGGLGAAVLAPMALGDAPTDDQAFVTQHVSDVVAVTPTRIADPTVTKVFSAPIYSLDISINQGENGTSDQKQLAARIDDKLVAISRPGTDEDCPGILKMFNPSFTLQSDDDAKTLQTALDLAFPTATDDDKKLVAFRHSGQDWTFIRGAFLNNKVLGFIFTTDAQGKITAAKFSLEIPA